MPKFIGQRISGATRIQDNAPEFGVDRVKLTYAQAAKLPAHLVMMSLNTSDRGARKVLAKRWFNWFSTADNILNNPASTENMRRRAYQFPS